MRKSDSTRQSTPGVLTNPQHQQKGYMPGAPAMLPTSAKTMVRRIPSKLEHVVPFVDRTRYLQI